MTYISVFEFLRHGELLEIPSETPLSEEETWKSFRDVVQGLEYCKLYFMIIIYLASIFNMYVFSTPPEDHT